MLERERENSREREPNSREVKLREDGGDDKEGKRSRARRGK